MYQSEWKWEEKILQNEEETLLNIKKIFPQVFAEVSVEYDILVQSKVAL